MPVEAQSLARAVAVLRSGGLVAFPTETVYGLGADAENAGAVREVFRVKGRPPTHPLIVHLAERSMLADWARSVPRAAERLAEAFWPGPLTLIVPRSSRALDVVTGGVDTVGLRVPSHPTALSLLRDFGGGVAAPSANRFGAVSPTRAEHVRADLGGDVEVILDGGECQVGVESTIVDVSGPTPTILRHGDVTPEQLADVLGAELSIGGSTPAPGNLASHYAPRARVIAVAPEELSARLASERASGVHVGAIAVSSMPPEQAARVLYAELRALDAEGYDVILVSMPERTGLGWALADRVSKAAAPRG